MRVFGRQFFGRIPIVLMEQDADLAQALTWIDRSLKVGEHPENLHVKARLQMMAGQSDEAQKTLARALKLARERKAAPGVLGPLEATAEAWKKGAPAPRAPNGQMP